MISYFLLQQKMISYIFFTWFAIVSSDWFYKYDELDKVLLHKHISINYNLHIKKHGALKLDYAG